MKLSALLEEYAKHSALNFGQVLHGALHLGSHPDIDPVANHGTFRHFYRSALLALGRGIAVL